VRPNLRRLAPQGLPLFLALEVPIWPPADPGRPPTADSQAGRPEPLLGRGADRKRAAAETRSCAYRRGPYASICRSCRPHRPAKPRGDQRWSTFLGNHARCIVACDFCVAATATFRILYVLVVIEHASRRLIHLNATAHPSAAWTLQQLRETIRKPPRANGRDRTNALLRAGQPVCAHSQDLRTWPHVAATW